jgi:hypothetical protein
MVALGVQELPPCRVVVPLRRWRDPQGFKDAADRGGADPVAELEEFALDALVSPAVVLGGEPLDERGDLGADRRASRVVRVGPFLSGQATMPSQNGARCDQPVCLQPSGQLPDQRGQHRPVGPVQPRPRITPAQHGDLVPQHQQFRVLRRWRSAKQDQPAAKPDEDEVEQAK